MQKKDQININTIRRRKNQNKFFTKRRWAVKKWPKMHLLFFFGKTWTKTPETKKMRKG